MPRITHALIASAILTCTLATLLAPQPSLGQEAEKLKAEAEQRERAWWPYVVQDLVLRGYSNEDQSKLDLLASGDKLVALDGVELKDNDHLIVLLQSHWAGESVEFGVERTIKKSEGDDEVLKLTIPLTLFAPSRAYGTIMRGGRTRFQSPEEIHPEWSELEAQPWEELVARALKSRDASHERQRLDDAFDYALNQIPGFFRNDEVYYLLRRPFHSEVWGRRVGDALSAPDATIDDLIYGALGLSRVHAEPLTVQEVPELELAVDASYDDLLKHLEAWLDAIDASYAEAFAPLGDAITEFFATGYQFHPLKQDEALVKALLQARNIDWPKFDRAIQLSAMLAEMLVPGGELYERLKSDAPEDLSTLTLPASFVVAGADSDKHEGSHRVIIDLGGDDRYELLPYLLNEESTCSTLVIDMQGNDRYASALGSIAAGIGASSMLIDASGNDTYNTPFNNGGFAFCGLGLLYDQAGNDRYMGGENTQGAGLLGVGLLVDRAGNDRYDAHTFAQGVGYTRGVGLLIDSTGDDNYSCTGHRPSPYGDAGEYMGFGQGVGFGFRFGPPLACGGIGGLIDGDGRDVYQVGQFGLGIGYFFGAGFVNDRGGDDVYRAARYGLGTSAHYGIGIVLDDGGNDNYYAQSVAEMAGTWDMSVGVLVDAAGDDHYQARGYALGAAAQNAYGLFWDKSGDDTYRGDGNDRSLGYDGGWNYGAGRNARNLGVFLDSAGDDTYKVPGRENHSWGAAENKHYAIWEDAGEE